MSEEKDQIKEVKNPVKETSDDLSPERIALEELKAMEDNSGPHDQFDWEGAGKHNLPYTESEIAGYLKDYDASLSLVTQSEIVKGVVSAIQDGDIVLDINYKSDGLVSLSEFRDMPDLKVGDTVDVYVEEQEDDRGQLVLSRRKAKLLGAWDAIVDSYENGTVIKGTNHQ